MNHVLNRILVCAAVAAGLWACDKNEAKAPPESTQATVPPNAAAPTPVAPTPAPAAPAAAIAESDLATPADFEVEAEKAITAKNYKAEMALLEAEVSKE